MPPDYASILIVDNAEFIRMVARLRLEAAGVSPKNIHEAANGQEAYEQIITRGIGNILSDYEMEVMDGIQLATKLLLTEQRQDLRFVLFSGSPMAKITAALAGIGLDIPLIPKTRLRESWARIGALDAWFPELALTLSRQQK